MKIKNQLLLERLIGKIDNDFNISESDWIPRVAAWTIDALSQMNILPMQLKTRQLEVNDRIAQFPCMVNARTIQVFDENGCEIDNLSESSNCNCSSTNSNNNSYNTQQIDIVDTSNTTGINTNKTYDIIDNNSSRNFVIQGNNIELNFDCDTIIVKSYEIATYFDEYYQCECPYIYDNGLLLEALAWYCLYKYLSRGSKHPVYDLKSNNQITNPYMQWLVLKPKAAASVKINLNTTSGWNNFFYNSTFLPRG